jgi:LysM repeat protein
MHLRHLHITLALLAALVLLSVGCAKEPPPSYYVHFTGDRQLDKHLSQAHDALDDLNFEVAENHRKKAHGRLSQMALAGYPPSVVAHYRQEMAKLSARVKRAKSEGAGSVHITFLAGYAPEKALPTEETLRLGDLRVQLNRLPYQRRVEINHMILRYTDGPDRAQYDRYLRRLAPYRNHVENVFASYGVPDELICVAMIESAGDPTRVSPAGAAGLWQFIPETARKYGLMVNDKVDQRFDPVLQTYAAARYMKFLLNIFDDDVAAALAGYNCGEGLVDVVLSHPKLNSIWHAPYHGATNPEELPSLPHETYDYIARFWAVAVIYQNLKEYGFTMPPAADDPFLLVRINGAAECDKLAADLEIAPERLIAMNPSLRFGSTPEDETTPVRLPPNDPYKYVQSLRKAEFYRISFYYRHRVTANQTLRAIAEKYGVPAAKIAEDNDLGETNRLETSSIIRIVTTAGNEKARLASKENVRYWRSVKGTLWDKGGR